MTTLLVAMSVHGIPKANRRFEMNDGRLFTSTAHRDFIRDVVYESRRVRPAEPYPLQGLLDVTIVSFWTRIRHLSDIDVPIGDVDSPGKAALDSLKKAGVIDDDVRVGELRMIKLYDKENGPFTHIQVWRGVDHHELSKTISPPSYKSAHPRKAKHGPRNRK